MRAELEEQMAKLQADVQAKQNDEDAKREAEEREAKLRIEMEFKLEQEKIAAAEREAERQDRIRKEEQLALMLPRPGNKQTTIHSKHWPIKPKLRPKNKRKWPKLRPKPKLNPHQIDLITHLVLGYAFPLFHLCHHRWDIVCTWYD